MPTQAIAQTLNLAPLDAPSSGDVAARAFTCFDQGMRPDEVVIHLTLPADTVEYLWRTWARLRGLVPLSFEVARVLREALYCNRPLANGSDLVAAVQRYADRPIQLCTCCKNGCPEYCTACPAREANRALRKSGRRLAGGGGPRASKNSAKNAPSGALSSTPPRALSTVSIPIFPGMAGVSEEPGAAGTTDD